MRKLLSLSALALTLACSTQTQNAPTPVAETPASTPPPVVNTPSPSANFSTVMNEYVVGFLRRNPVVATYLGGSQLDPSLANVDAELRDHSARALSEEDAWLQSIHQRLSAMNESSLDAKQRIDRHIAMSQIEFLLHQHGVRRYQERSLDTYTDEPFRGVDFQLQGLTQTGRNSYGTYEEWQRVIDRTNAVPAYMDKAIEQMRAGIANKNTPDHRMLFRNGITTAEADAVYFEKTLPGIARERIADPKRDELLSELDKASVRAAKAYRDLEAFIGSTFFNDTKVASAKGVKPEFAGDRFIMGEAEYNWALEHNLHLTKNAGQLYEEAWPVVENTRNEMIALARQIGTTRGWKLPAEGPAAVRAVFDKLGEDYPKSDAEMIGWYDAAAQRLVEYARKTGVFDVPADYKLEVTQTPPPLRASIDGAAYYPAPPFKNSGVGRFYVTPTDNDLAALKDNNRAAIADLSAHEGFPGHDWHYKVMTQYRSEISPVRWLTPGAVEDSSSMWEDSMAAEGWALYSEALMAEPQPGAPNGFYTPEERLYQLRGKLYRDLRVRIDTGIHTNRLSYDDATTLFSQIVDFLPGSCQDAALLKKNDAKRSSCDSSERAIFRYSKWPTQAITYRLGKEQIFALRDEAQKVMGANFSPKKFHVLFMRQGTIPTGLFREELLRQLQAEK